MYEYETTPDNYTIYKDGKYLFSGRAIFPKSYFVNYKKSKELQEKAALRKIKNLMNKE